jgi:hypothetical protein
MEDEDSIIRYDYRDSIYTGYSDITTIDGCNYTLESNVNWPNWNSNGNCLSKPIRVTWVPKEDVTTYELAMCTTLIYVSHFDKDGITPEKFTELIKDMDPKMFRHFDIEDPNFDGIEWDIIK